MRINFAKASSCLLALCFPRVSEQNLALGAHGRAQSGVGTVGVTLELGQGMCPGSVSDQLTSCRWN